MPSLPQQQDQFKTAADLIRQGKTEEAVAHIKANVDLTKTVESTSVIGVMLRIGYLIIPEEK